MAKQFTFRCPDDLWEAIQHEALHTQRELTAVVVEALRLGLSMPSPDTGLAARVSNLERELSRISERLGTPAHTPARQHVIQRMTEPTSKPELPIDREGWLSYRDAFIAIGGNPDDPTSKVSTNDGKAYPYASFRLRATVKDYTRFGLVEDHERRVNGVEWLRLDPSAQPPANQPSLFDGN